MATGSDSSDELALDISGVRKTYRGNVEALKGISLKVPKGCIFGLLGPNGAGKSTLIKILTTLIRPSACEGTMLGSPVGTRRILKQVGLLAEHAQFPDYLTGRQVVEFSAGMSGVPVSVTRKRTDELLELVSMSDDQRRKISGYSKGMKQRIGLAQALVNDPAIVFLDESTDGVDPTGRREFRDIIKRLKHEGKTVFVNTHILAELELIADRVAILSEGRILKEGALADLKKKDPSYEISYEGTLPDAARDFLMGAGIAISTENIEVVASQPEDIQSVIDGLRANKVVISGLKRDSQSLEDLFIEAIDSSQGQPTPPPIK